MRLYLASRSPRRREILCQLGFEFQCLSDFADDALTLDEVDETPLSDELPLNYVERVTRAKGLYGCEVLTRTLNPDLLDQAIVLAADTVVALDEKIFGKPSSSDDAARMLQLLSGRTHQVLTGIVLLKAAQYQMQQGSFYMNCNTVQFGELQGSEIKDYVESQEPMDKAGAYGIQGYAGGFVKHIAGSYTGIMGLPAYEVAKMLGEHGCTPSFTK